jgi:hexosaminidase
MEVTTVTAAEQGDFPALIPWPAELAQTGATYELTAQTSIATGAGTEAIASLLHDELSVTTGLSLPVAAADATDSIKLAIDSALPHEGYRLAVAGDGVTIVGGDAAGVFYGTRTLRQLMPPQNYGGSPEGVRWLVAGVAITDQPAFGWRGSMLDVGRNFQPKEFVLRYIDLLALHKFNVLHFHISEDQGWRIEIRRYPKLTEVGAWRSGTLIGRPNRTDPSQDRYDDVRHGGFYTQEEIREIVSYAAARFVTVVPEIDLPGHSQAAIAAYPELGNTGKQIEVGRTWGIIEDVLNVEESTVQFFKNVFDEIFELFPSTFIHVGGDECPKVQWKASPRAQELMKERGLSNEDELQSWFIGQLDKYFAEKGRRLIGWDEILEGGLAENAAVMSWRGIEGGIEAAKAGHDVVMAPTTHVYFDYYQSEDQDNEPLAIGGYLPLSKVYEFQPVPPELADVSERVLGSQFQLWSEYLPTAAQVEYMAFPRGCAVAEVVWSKERQSYDDFLARLRLHLERLDALEVGYRPLDR